MSVQTQYGEGPCDVEWWFGEGLSYTTFEYTALEVEPKTIHDGQQFRVGDMNIEIVNTKNTNLGYRFDIYISLV